MGDFNALVGQRQNGETRALGPYCYGKRDLRGEKLIEHALENNLVIMNSVFKKKTARMWTWISPKNKKSQIDYILTNTKENFTNIEIIDKFNFSSDHRLIRGTYNICWAQKSRIKVVRLGYPKLKPH